MSEPEHVRAVADLYGYVMLLAAWVATGFAVNMIFMHLNLLSWSDSGDALVKVLVWPFTLVAGLIVFYDDRLSKRNDPDA